MCEKSDCSYLLDGTGLQKDFSRLDQSIPLTWLTAHRILKILDMSLRETDQSYILSGNVSLTHLIRSCSHNNPQIPATINGTLLRCLRLKGIRRFGDAGKWMIDRYGTIFTHIIQSLFDNSWSVAARNNWTKFSDAIHNKMRINDVLSGPADLILPRHIRKENAEHHIVNLAKVCGLPSSQHSKSSVWASDGSMVPSSVGILDTKTVIGAATGTQTLVMKVAGNNVSILHGELIGMISALILSKFTRNNDQNNQQLLTDHLNTVRLVKDSQTDVDQIPRLRYMNGRFYYHWILDLTHQSTTQIDYTPGHSTETTLEAKLNNEADFYASKSPKYAKNLPTAPIPTFYMNNFTFHSKKDGWIESNVPSYVDTHMTR